MKLHYSHPRQVPVIAHWMTQISGQKPYYNTTPEWIGDVEIDESVSSLVAIAKTTWSYAIEEGLPTENVEVYGVDHWASGLWRWRYAWMRVLREIDLYGPVGVKNIVENHRSIFKHPYKQLVKGCGECAGALPSCYGGGGGVEPF